MIIAQIDVFAPYGGFLRSTKRRTAILLPVERKKRLTFLPVSAIMLVTMAEVAGSISTILVWQLPKWERGHRRRNFPVPNGFSWGCTENVQNCHPKGWSADQGNAVSVPCVAQTRGILCLRGLTI